MPREPRGTRQWTNWAFTLFDDESFDDPDGYPDLWNAETMRYLVMGKEICPDTGRKHFQCYVQLKDKKTLTWMKTNVSTTAHFEGAKANHEKNRAYCVKDRVFKEWGQIATVGSRQDINVVVQRINNGETVDDLMFDEECAGTIARSLNFFRQLERCYIRKNGSANLRARMEVAVLRPWQSDVVSLVAEAPDTRKVFWYYDECGNTGKSFLVDYLVSMKGAIVFTNGKMADMAFAYKEESIVVFDLARCQADKIDNVYMAVENFKNGRMFSPKYESQTKVFPVPHVLVFANFEPDRSKLSQDRWHVTRVLG